MRLGGGLLFLVVGLCVAPYLAWSAVFIHLLLATAAGAALARNRNVFRLPLALFFILFGICGYHLQTAPTTDQPFINQLPDTKSVVEGRITSISSRPDNGLRVDLDKVTIDPVKSPHALAGKVRITIENSDSPLQPGDRVRLLSKLREPRNFATPGAFNYVRYLKRRNIVATGYCAKTSDIALLPQTKEATLTEAVGGWRHALRQHLSATLGQDAPLVLALAIGDQGAITVKQRRLLAAGGLSHLFAISGLHIGLVAGLLYLLLRTAQRRLLKTAIPPKRLFPPLILPVLALYMIFTGAATSTTRALTMLAIATLLCCLSRRCRPVDLLALVAFSMLVFDPLLLFEASFQLSFAGAAGIVTLLPRWQPRLADKPAWLRAPFSLFMVTLSATLATAPLVIFHFQTFAPAGLLLNLLAVPLVSLLIIPAILVATVATPLVPGFANFIFQAVAELLKQMTILCEQLVTLPPLTPTKLHLPAPLVLFGSLLVLILLTSEFNRTLRLGALCGLMLLLFFYLGPIQQDGTLRVTALDVGQGDATLLQTPDGANYLVDGGGLYSRHFDTGERLVAPALGHLGVRHLDAVILSHDHPDHRKGLLYIIEHFSVAEFWSPLPAEKLHPQLARLLERRNIPCRIFPPGWTNMPSGLKLFSACSDGGNDNSLVIFAGHERDGVLLTGDLEKAGISKLAAAPAPGPVTLLKSPHHGSRRSDPSPLLDKYPVKAGFLSAGQSNRFGLPHPDILTTYEAASIPLFRTDISGSLRFTSSPSGWGITHWKNGLFR